MEKREVEEATELACQHALAVERALRRGAPQGEIDDIHRDFRSKVRAMMKGVCGEAKPHRTRERPFDFEDMRDRVVPCLMREEDTVGGADMMGVTSDGWKGHFLSFSFPREDPVDALLGEFAWWKGRPGFAGAVIVLSREMGVRVKRFFSSEFNSSPRPWRAEPTPLALTKVCEELGVPCLPRNVMGWDDAKEVLRECFVRCEEDPTGGDPEQWKSDGRDGLETETCDTTIPDYCECIYVHESV